MTIDFEKLHKEVKNEISKQNERGLTHNFDHLERVYKIAMLIAEREGADKDVVGAVALLHDVVFYSDDEKNKTHPDESAKLAKTILKRFNYPSEKIDRVLEAIPLHDMAYKEKYQKLPSLEAQIVLEADKIDAIGAIGIIRNCTLRIERNIDLFSLKTIDKMISFIERAKKYIKTSTGKELFEERYKFTINFFNQLKKELNEV